MQKIPQQLLDNKKIGTNNNLMLHNRGMRFEDLLKGAFGKAKDFFGGGNLKSPIPQSQVLGTPERALKQRAISQGYIPANPLTFDELNATARKAPPQPAKNRVLDVNRYRGQSKSPIKLPNKRIQNLIWDIFPKDATRSAVMLAGENRAFDETPGRNPNSGGSKDVGFAQNNTGTFEDLLRIASIKNSLAGQGINTIEDTETDTKKSLQLMKTILDFKKLPRWTGDEEGHPFGNAHYGWQYQGFNLFPEKTLEELAQDPTYFMVKDFLKRQKQTADGN